VAAVVGAAGPATNVLGRGDHHGGGAGVEVIGPSGFHGGAVGGEDLGALRVPEGESVGMRLEETSAIGCRRHPTRMAHRQGTGCSAGQRFPLT
jgi:hypothetical protein